MSNRAEASRPAKADLTSILFDLRSVIGLLFVVYGLVLTILGLLGTSEEDLAKAGGLALNLWTGLVMLVVGIGFYAWAFTKPPLPPPPADIDEGGPLAGRGHGH